MIARYFVYLTADGSYDVIERPSLRTVVRGESFAVADSTAWCLNHPDAWSGSEACELADAIRAAAPVA